MRGAVREKRNITQRERNLFITGPPPAVFIQSASCDTEIATVHRFTTTGYYNQSIFCQQGKEIGHAG